MERRDEEKRWREVNGNKRIKNGENNGRYCRHQELSNCTSYGKYHYYVHLEFIQKKIGLPLGVCLPTLPALIFWLIFVYNLFGDFLVFLVFLVFLSTFWFIFYQSILSNAHSCNWRSIHSRAGSSTS